MQDRKKKVGFFLDLMWGRFIEGSLDEALLNDKKL